MLNFDLDAQNGGNPAHAGNAAQARNAAPSKTGPSPAAGSSAAAQGVELEPWLVVLGEGEQSSLAMWQIAGDQMTQTNHLESATSNAQLTLAVFSSSQQASDYAEKCCSGVTRIVQVERTRFLSLIVDCFRQGIRYATLNPGDSTAQSLFVLRDVLSAAKRELSRSQ